MLRLSTLRACALCLIPLAGIACMSPRTHYATYVLALADVEKPANSRERFGNLTLARGDSAGVTQYRFADSLIAVTIVPLSDRFLLSLANQSPHSIRVIWDRAAFIDVTGRSQRVIHSHVRLAEAHQTQPSSIIPRGSHIDDQIIPAEHVSPSTYCSRGWCVAPLLPTVYALKGDTLTALDSIARFRAARLRLLLPIEVEDVLNEYTLSFAISDVRLTPVIYR